MQEDREREGVQRRLDEPSPSLRMLPVVLAFDGRSVELARAGALRAGRGPSMAIVRGPGAIPSLLEAATFDRELVIVGDGDRLSPTDVALLVDHGARPVPAVRAGNGSIVDPGWLERLGTWPEGLNVPVPSVGDDEQRRRLWDALRAAGLDERHHLVEVDGRPALEEVAASGHAVEDPNAIEALAAGAAGVLAGRMVAGNRRWTSLGS